MKNDEIAKLLGQAAVYGNNSFLGDYRNAHAALGKLNDLYANNTFDDPTYYDKMSAGLRGQMGSSVAGSLISGLSGATGIVNNAMQATKLGDTSAYENELEDYVDYSNYNFANYDQLSNAMSQNYLSVMPSYEDIRGMSNGEKAGNVLSSTLRGAQSGMQIGGPIGAAIGAGAGLLTSGLSIISGDKAADRKQQQLNAQASLAQYSANQNFAAAHERIGDYNNRKGVVNAVAKGGPIDRKQSITSFANRVLGSAKAKERTASNITRSSVDGGLKVRIRTK